MAKGPNKFVPSGKLKALELREGFGIGVSNLLSGRFRYNELLNHIQFSENTGAYVNLMSLGGDIINVKLPPYNAIGDGIADDTVAIQAAFTAAAITNNSVFFPAGTYRVTNTLLLDDAYGINVFGAGKWASTVFWDKPAGLGGTVLLLRNCREVSISDMAVHGNADPAKRPLYCIESRGDPGVPYTFAPTNNRYTNVKVGGNAADSCDIGVGYTIVGPDQNNDQGQFTGCALVNCKTAGFWNQHTNGKVHQFDGCGFLYSKRGAWFTSGSGQFHDCYFGVHSEASILLDSVIDPIIVDGCLAEECERFIDHPTGYGENAWPLVVTACKIHQVDTAASPYVIRMCDSGPLTVEGCIFEGGVHGAPPRIYFAQSAAGSGLIVKGNEFQALHSSEHVPGVDLPGGALGIKAEIDGNLYRDAAGTSLLSLDGLVVDATPAINIPLTMNNWIVVMTRPDGACFATIPSGAPPGFAITIKDGRDTITTSGYPVTIIPASGNIDGVAGNKVFRHNRAAYTLVSDGTNWQTVAAVEPDHVLWAQSIDAVATQLTVDGNADVWANRLVIPTGKTVDFELFGVSTCTAGTDIGKSASWYQTGTITNAAGTTTTMDAGPFNLLNTALWSSAAFTPKGATGGDVGLLAMTLVLTAGGATGNIIPTFTGHAGGAPNTWLTKVTIKFNRVNS